MCDVIGHAQIFDHVDFESLKDKRSQVIHICQFPIDPIFIIQASDFATLASSTKFYAFH